MQYKKFKASDKKISYAYLLDNKKEKQDVVNNDHSHELTTDTEYFQVIFETIKKRDVHGIEGLEMIDFSHTCDLDDLIATLKNKLGVKSEEQKEIKDQN